jgi:hypothetical protein
VGAVHRALTVLFYSHAHAPPTNVTSLAKHRLLREYAREAARLREFAACVTTGPLRALLLDEAEKHERLAKQENRVKWRSI